MPISLSPLPRWSASVSSRADNEEGKPSLPESQCTKDEPESGRRASPSRLLEKWILLQTPENHRQTRAPLDSGAAPLPLRFSQGPQQRLSDCCDVHEPRSSSLVGLQAKAPLCLNDEPALDLRSEAAASRRASLARRFRLFRKVVEERKEREDELAQRRLSVGRLINRAFEENASALQSSSPRSLECVRDTRSLTARTLFPRFPKVLVPTAAPRVFLKTWRRAASLRLRRSQQRRSLKKPPRRRGLKKRAWATGGPGGGNGFNGFPDEEETADRPACRGLVPNANGQRRRCASLLALCAVLQRRLIETQRQPFAARRWLRRLRPVELIGRGASGAVWKVRDSESGRNFALKVIRKSDCSGKASDARNAQAYSERHVLIRGSRRCQHLVRLEAAFQNSDSLFLLQELVDGPSLLQILESRHAPKTLPEQVVRRIAAELAVALHALHAMGFAHRDVKPANIRFDLRDGVLKLLDVGLAHPRRNPSCCEGATEASPWLSGEREGECHGPVESFAARRLKDLYATRRPSSGIEGTVHYLAPEVLALATQASAASKTQDFAKADWWAYGATLFECLFGEPPFARLFSLKPNFSPPSAESRGEGEEGEGAAAGEEALPSLLGCASFETNLEFVVSVVKDWKRLLRIPPPPWRVGADARQSSSDDAFSASKEAVDLLRKLLCSEDRRLGFEELLTHPWFRGVNWQALMNTPKKATSRVKNPNPSTASSETCLSLDGVEAGEQSASFGFVLGEGAPCSRGKANECAASPLGSTKEKQRPRLSSAGERNAEGFDKDAFTGGP